MPGPLSATSRLRVSNTASSTTPKTKTGHTHRPRRGQQVWPVVPVHENEFRRGPIIRFRVHWSRGDFTTDPSAPGAAAGFLFRYQKCICESLPCTCYPLQCICETPSRVPRDTAWPACRLQPASLSAASFSWWSSSLITSYFLFLQPGFSRLRRRGSQVWAEPYSRSSSKGQPSCGLPDCLARSSRLKPAQEGVCGLAIDHQLKAGGRRRCRLKPAGRGGVMNRRQTL